MRCERPVACGRHRGKLVWRVRRHAGMKMRPVICFNVNQLLP